MNFFSELQPSKASTPNVIFGVMNWIYNELACLENYLDLPKIYRWFVNHMYKISIVLFMYYFVIFIHILGESEMVNATRRSLWSETDDMVLSLFDLKKGKRCRSIGWFCIFSIIRIRQVAFSFWNSTVVQYKNILVCAI